jgi:hypothetical protein
MFSKVNTYANMQINLPTEGKQKQILAFLLNKEKMGKSKKLICSKIINIKFD